jgi:2-polyprenyl-3-methyl-5-hydroxy-6-metoxy-1,4-benzoquinol methylase
VKQSSNVVSEPASEAQVGTEGGRFYRKQQLSPSRVVAFSHRSRFGMARRLVAPYAGQRLLDYGCGDGTFLSESADEFPASIGADISRSQIEDCVQRLGGVGSLRFLHTSELSAPEFTGYFDIATCMETLEHCPEPELREALADLVRLVKPGGTIIISVPIEIGPTLLAKHAIRRALGWRGVGDYRYTESYTGRELLKMTFANATTEIERPLYDSNEHPHKGFNWRALERRLKDLMEVREIRFSPFPWSAGWVSSQVWFVCRTPLSAR